MTRVLIRGGRVIDHASKMDMVADVLVVDGAVAALGRKIAAQRDVEEVMAEGCLVVPGLVDLHAHIYSGGTSAGIHPDELARRSALTTIVDAGSAGAANIRGLVEHVMARSTTRGLCFINIAFPGIYALSENVMLGEAGEPRLLHVGECVAAARKFHRHVIGVKVRLGRGGSGDMGISALRPALEAAGEAGLPLMVHIDTPPPKIDEVLELLRPGDILTHCCRPGPNSLVEHENVLSAAKDARARGVLFDVGHGLNSFSFESCRKLLDSGFLPDTLSSDSHRLSVDGLGIDLLDVMSRFLALGLPLHEVVRASTVTPSTFCGLPTGLTAPGKPLEASVLRLDDRPRVFRDASGDVLRSDGYLVPVGRFRDGRWELYETMSAPSSVPAWE